MLKKLFLVPFLCVVLSSIDSKCSLNEDENLINDTRTSLPREEKKSPRKLLKEAKCLKKFHKNPHLSYEIMENILSDVGHSDKLYSHQLSWGKDLYAYESPELSKISQIKRSDTWCLWDENFFEIKHLNLFAWSFVIFHEQTKYLFWIFRHPQSFHESSEVTELKNRKGTYRSNTLKFYAQFQPHTKECYPLIQTSDKPKESPRMRGESPRHRSGSKTLKPLFTQGTPRSEELKKIQQKNSEGIQGSISHASENYSPTSSSFSPKKGPLELKTSPSEDRESIPLRKRRPSISASLSPKILINSDIENHSDQKIEEKTPITISTEIKLPQNYKLYPTHFVFNLPATTMATTYVFSFSLPKELQVTRLSKTESSQSEDLDQFIDDFSTSLPLDDELNQLLAQLKNHTL